MLKEYYVLDSEGNKTDIIIEHLCKHPAPEYITSDTGERAVVKTVSLIARTASSWSDSCGTKYGVNGFYNRGLGCWVSSDKEADRIGAERGLVRMDELGDKNWLDDKMDSMGQEEAETQRSISKYEAANASHFNQMNWS